MSNLGTIHTGWFGIPGGPVSKGKVHLVRASTMRPVCGARHGERMAFQYCAGRAYMDWVDCKNCLRWAQ